MFGSMNGLASVHLSLDKFLEENHYPDIRILTDEEDRSLLNRFNKKNYEEIDSRLSISTILKKEKQIISVKASTYGNQNENDFYVWKEKNNYTKYYDILVEKKFSENNHINLGDTVSLKIGDKYYKFYVSKIISIPEAMVNIPINGLWGSINDYGNVYIHKNVLETETKKIKQNYYKELNQKEEELSKEEKSKLEEYNSQNEVLQKALREYNNQSSYYQNIIEELNQKNNELQTNKNQLLELSQDYLDTMNKIDDFSSLIDTYINSYNDLSDNAKNYIDKIIEDKYPDLSIEEVEFVSDILFYMIKGKVDEVFDPNTEINQQITEKILIMDTIKVLIDYQYDYYRSDEVKAVIEQLKKKEVVEDQLTYGMLIFNLSLLYSKLGEVTEDNILTYYEITNAILEEIHKVEEKLPFDSFQELYDTLENLKEMSPFLYGMVKEKYKPIIEEILKQNHKVKEELLNQVEKIYQSNKDISNKAELIKNLLIDFIKKIFDDTIKDSLKDYTEDMSGTPIEIIDRLLSQIEDGTNQANNAINKIKKELNTAYQTLVEKRMLLEDAHVLLMDSLSKAKAELSSKRKEINEYKGYESKINELLFQVKDSVDKENQLESIKEKELKDIKILDSYTYENSPVQASVNYNVVGLERVANITPTIIYIIILIVLFLFISLMIKQSKQEIAIFRLLGKTNNEIRLVYCINNFIVSVIGILLGFGLGSFLIRIITNYYRNLLRIPKAVYSIDYRSIILCFVATIIIVEIATLLATLELDKITPIEVLTKEEYQKKQTAKFTNIITKFLKPFPKFSFLVYTRNKRNFILGIICITATFSMIFTSLAYAASKDKIFEEYFDERINYDAQIFKMGTISDDEVEEIKNLNYVEDAKILRFINTTITKNGKKINITINAFDDNNDYIRIMDQKKNQLTIPKHGIIMEQHIAEELGIKKDDVITIQNKSFKVIDICFQSLGRTNYISLEDAKELESNIDSIIIKMNNKNQKQLVEKVSKDNNYLYTVDYDSLRKYNKKEFDSYNIISIIIIIFAIAIGIIIVLNINEYNLIEQKRTLAVFRSLGFHTSEISRNLAIQSIIPWILSLILGLPIGIVLSKIVLKAASSQRREYIYASGMKEIILTFIIVGLYMGIGHLLSMRKLKQINITEEIKERD